MALLITIIIQMPIATQPSDGMSLEDSDLNAADSAAIENIKQRIAALNDRLAMARETIPKSLAGVSSAVENNFELQHEANY